MATAFVAAIALSALALDAPAALKPLDAVGATTRVVVAMRGEGLFKPGEAEAKDKAKEAAKPLALKVETRLEFVEKTLAVGKDGAATKVVRRVEKAGTAINGEVRATSGTLRPEVAILVAEPRGGQVVVVSPGGPLTRSELELVQGPGDPLTLAALLPAGTVAAGESWGVGSDAARSLSGYDTLDDNALRATLASIDDSRAVARLAGEVRGSVTGGQGTVRIAGTFAFDRKAGRVVSLEVTRDETRGPGPVEAGLEIRSRLSVARRGVETPPELSDSALAGLPMEASPERELLLYKAPGGSYSLVHDRDWHIYWDGDRQAVLRRLAGGQVLAHCYLNKGPNAGKGKHQDPGQFRDDIKKAAGTRFVAILGEGEVEGSPEGGYRYKVSVQGREGSVDVLWYYYLIAGPGGDQELAVFTLGKDQQPKFADADLQLIGSFEWTGAAAKP